LTTLEAGYNLRKELLSWQREFYTSAMDEAGQDNLKAYVFGDQYDKTRTAHFIELLLRHRIKIYKANSDIIANGQSFKKG
jgi:hypothetical protein